MVNEKRLIDVEQAKRATYEEIFWTESEQAVVRNFLAKLPKVDAVSRGVHDQVRWERDVAIGQLEKHGISFGCTAPDIVKVVRCKDCKYYADYGRTWDCIKYEGMYLPNDDDFCSCGERKDKE